MAQAAAARAEEHPFYERSSATLLALQPSDPPPVRQETAAPWWATLRAHLEQRLISLRTWRQSWWTQNYSDLALFILPRRSIWLTQSAGGIPTPNNMTRGQPINTAIADPTATYAVRVCAGGLVSGLASPSRPWFKVVPASKRIQIDAAGRVWLDEIEDRMYAVLALSNFYNSFAVECEDLIVFGTAPVLAYEDEEDVVRFYNPAVGEYYIATSAAMRINVLNRQFVMTIAQIVDFFGVEKCPPEIQVLWRQKGAVLDQERIVAHSIEPNFGIAPNDAGKLSGNFTWREVYWIYGAACQEPLSVAGFIDQPFTCARWSIQSNDAYGRSPGMDVLPDVMQLQVMTRRMAEAIEKQVRPPLLASMDLKMQPSSQLPGEVTYVNNLAPGSGMRPVYEVNPDIAAMAANIQAIEARIKVGLFNDLFLMLEQQTGKMTAYEVAQKVQEKLQVIGPVIDGLLNESLKPKLRRTFGIMKRRGLIPDPPPSMQGVPLDVEFVSMLALSQKAAATGGIERLMAIVGTMQPIFPEVKDNINPDAVVREMNDLLGNPQKILNGPDDVAKMREAQAQQMAQQQKMAQISQMAEAAGKAAPAGQVLASLRPGPETAAAGE